MSDTIPAVVLGASGYVGGDITAGVLASGLAAQDAPQRGLHLLFRVGIEG